MGAGHTRVDHVVKFLIECGEGIAIVPLQAARYRNMLRAQPVTFGIGHTARSKSSAQAFQLRQHLIHLNDLTDTGFGHDSVAVRLHLECCWRVSPLLRLSRLKICCRHYSKFCHT